MTNIAHIVDHALKTTMLDQRNHQDLLLYNAFIACSTNNWMNEEYPRMVDMGTLAINMFDLDPTAYPSDVQSPDQKLQYVVDLLIDCKGAMIISRDQRFLNSLNPAERQRVIQTLNTAEQLARDVDQYVARQQSQTTRTSGRYRQQPTQHVATPSRTSRYSNATAVTIPTPGPTTINEGTGLPAHDIPVILKRSNNSMDYSNHRLATEMNPKTRRKPSKADFMGELANVDIVEVTGDVDVSKVTAIKPLDRPVATSIEHAKTLALISVAAKGGEYHGDHLLEYGYDTLNTLKVFTDAQAMQLYAVSEPALTNLSFADSLETLVEGIRSLLESMNPISRNIGRRLNLKATKHLQDLLKFKLVTDIVFDDFSEDALDIPALVEEACGGKNDIYDREWGYAVKSLLSCLNCVFMATGDEATAAVVNQLFGGSVSDRTIFWLEPSYVSALPVAFLDLGIDPTFSRLGQAYLTYTDMPELHASFSAVLARAKAANSAEYFRTFVTTDDGVTIELIQTDVTDSVDLPAHILIRTV